MKIATFVACASCALAAHSLATVYTVPHTLAATGQTTLSGTAAQVLSPMTTSASVDVFGPDGDTGAFSYNYLTPIHWSSSDSSGRTFELEFDVQFCQSRPEGPAFRFEMI